MYDATIGARLRMLRKWRGLTLTVLADRAGVSKSFLSMAERGERALDRRSHIAALATALQVSEAELVGGPHLTQDPVQSEPHTYIPPLRAALEAGLRDDPVVERARPLADLVALMNGPVEHHRRRCDYVAVGRYLPALLDELHHYAVTGDEQQRRAALWTLVEAHLCAARMARSLGYPDLGQLAAVRADEAAAALEDPMARAMAAYSLFRPHGANWDRVAALAGRAADRYEPHARDGKGLQVLGMLTLNAGLAAAVAGDGAAAQSWMDEAARLAAHVPDDVGNWRAFSSTNVTLWRITVAVERGGGGAEVAALATEVTEERLRPYPGRLAYFLADVGRGLARDRRHRDQAVTWLRRAEAAAPQRIRNDVKVREAVAVMLQQARVSNMGRELRGMAARMGIPH